jgi:transposase
VAIVEIDARAGDETAHLAGNEAIAIRADVTDPDSLAHVIRGPFSEITSFVSRGTDGLQTRRWREAVMSEPVSDGQIPGKYREFRALNVYQLAERGRKRHIVTDTGGLLVGAEVHPADIQNRDGAVLIIEAIHQLFPWLRHLFADSVYNGPNLREALVKFGDWTLEIVKRAADAAGFQLLPRRWVVERTLAWLNRNRRLAKDFEASIASAKAWVYTKFCAGHRRDARPKVRFAADSALEEEDLPPISKRKKQGNNLGRPSWCSPSKASVAPCSLCQGRFAPAPPVPPHSRRHP